jgi:class 3 adenylate cyclase
MAELEALAEIKAVPPPGGSRDATPGQYTWRYPLLENKTIRLGSDPAQCDWVVPEDRMISRFHATLDWDGSRLLVSRRPVTPEYPKPPQNHIWFRNAPVESCEVRAGEWFVIGQTRFTVHAEEESAQASPVDATVVQRREEYTRAELEKVPFSDPATFIKALEQLPNSLRMVTKEPDLFRQMLKVAMTGLARADASAIVRVLPEGPPDEPRVVVVEQNVRAGQTPGADFTPSRKLVRRAVRERKSCLHLWSTNPKDIDPAAGLDHTMTLGALRSDGATPWAICTPFQVQDGLQFALYAGGRLRTEELLEQPGRLTEYQKFVEILVGLMETTRRTLKLAHQTRLLRELLPGGVRKHLDDPERFEALIRPAEKEVTVLFCDLRNYSGFAEEHGATLAGAWREIAVALDTMSGAVTERGGIVAGFRGDAVLGFWGWPDAQADQAARAAEAALRIHEKLHGWMTQKRCGVGLTHGRALAGRLGAHDLAVLDLYGPDVNLAFRLEEMTKAFGVGIIVSDAFAARLAASDPAGLRWRLRPLGKVRPRGMKTPVAAHELSPTTGGSWLGGDLYEGPLAQWREAVEWFTAGDWTRARQRLEDLFEDDPAAQCLIRHMDRTRGRPPTDWDGAFLPRPPSD